MKNHTFMLLCAITLLLTLYMRVGEIAFNHGYWRRSMDPRLFPFNFPRDAYEEFLEYSIIMGPPRRFTEKHLGGKRFLGGLHIAVIALAIMLAGFILWPLTLYIDRRLRERLLAAADT